MHKEYLVIKTVIMVNSWLSIMLFHFNFIFTQEMSSLCLEIMKIKLK